MASAVMGNPGVTQLTEILTAFTISCLLLVVVKSFWRWVPTGTTRPPGPRGYPLIGNILDLGKNPHLTLAQMSEKYGEVMLINLGTRPVLVLNGLATIRQALIKQGDDFVGRPDLYSFQFIADGQSIAFGRSSIELWQSRRKLAQNALRIFSTSATPMSSMCPLEDSVSKEADYLILKFQELMKEKNHFEPYRYLVVSVANVICAMCFGKRYMHDDQELLSIVNLNNEFGEVTGSGNPADFIPILKYLPSCTMKAFKDLNLRFNALVQKIIKEHYANFDKNNIRDITDSLINHCQTKNLDVNANIQLADDKIISIVSDIFGAGFDTVTTGLSWSLLYLVTYPEIQKKIQQEIDEVIGKERKPKLSDRCMLHYTEAFILEVFRHSSFMPFTIPHCAKISPSQFDPWSEIYEIQQNIKESTTKDTVLNGYYIPRDTCVFVNQWQVNHDPKLWDNPSSFNPERFLAADGSGINRVESEKVLLFGLGKRRCIGENIGRGEIFLFLTILLQKLEFDVGHRERLDTTPQYGLTMKPQKCEDYQIKLR